MWLVRLIGRYWAGSALEPPLWIGDIKASFNISGILPEASDDLYIDNNILAIVTFEFFNTQTGTPAGPGEAPFGIFSIAIVTST